MHPLGAKVIGYQATEPFGVGRLFQKAKLLYIQGGMAAGGQEEVAIEDGAHLPKQALDLIRHQFPDSSLAKEAEWLGARPTSERGQ